MPIFGNYFPNVAAGKIEFRIQSGYNEYIDVSFGFSFNNSKVNLDDAVFETNLNHLYSDSVKFHLTLQFNPMILLVSM